MEDHILVGKSTKQHQAKVQLTKSQKTSVGILTALSVAIPVFVIYALSPIKPISTPASGPITPTVTSYITPTSEVTPTPPPSDNNNPVITTARLNNARVNRSYKALIQGYDVDLNDTLEFSITGNDWLAIANCTTRQRKIFWFRGQKVNVISCTLSGTPTQKGLENVTLTLTDGHTETTKTLSFRVR